MRRRKSREVESLLRDRIATGHWGADGGIPAERELAETLGVARNTLRTALKALQDDGLIGRRVGRGTIVKRDSGEGLASIMARMTDASPRDLMHARLIIEPQAAAAAALHARDVDLGLLGAAHARASAATRSDDFENSDAEFHRLIFASTRNEFLVNLHEILQVIRARKPWIEIKRRTFSEDRRRAYCAEHASILSALASRDPQAALRAMTAHMASVGANLFGSITLPFT